ncbi:hypothetical protein B296_00041914 [Ensete ventricosum]|uniref:Peptidase M24 domain-containing protein n=1 Tax=Ensete ventricosum TaxID=4639 RepID=A0A426Y9Z2_ENSVE|nr:hypothetical protein B296_00041914 [Ensete ventricosum]
MPHCRKLEDGDIVNVDVTVYYKGVHGEYLALNLVKSYCGHGIGELFHCAPNIPHYGSILATLFASGVWRDRLWPDGWTAVTSDGKRSAQFEHTLLVSGGHLIVNC